MRKYVFAICMMVVWFSGCGGDDVEGGGADGAGCASVGSWACFDNTTHLCKSTGWEAKTDCSLSPTENCQCIVYSGVGGCTAGGRSGSIEAVADNLCQ